MFHYCLFVLLFSITFGCKIIEPNDKFNIILKIKTSNCTFSGTDTFLAVHFPNPDKDENHHLKPNLGPFKIRQKDGDYARDSIKHLMIPWPIIKRSIGNRTLCWPDPKFVVIERQQWNFLIPEFFSAWKPEFIKVKLRDLTINGTKTSNYSHEFSKDCSIDWIESSGFYQIGPSYGQLQYLGSNPFV